MTKEIRYQIIGFIIILFFAIILNIQFSFINSLLKINVLQNTEIKKLKDDLEKVNYKYDLLINLSRNMNEISNERKRSIIELKISQDSIIIDLLNDDLITNKELLKLINTWSTNKILN